MFGAASSISFRLSFRMLRRDWHAGELRVLLAAVMIAVACVSSVAFFTDRIAQALQQQTGGIVGRGFACGRRSSFTCNNASSCA